MYEITWKKVAVPALINQTGYEPWLGKWIACKQLQFEFLTLRSYIIYISSWGDEKMKLTPNCIDEK